MILDLNNKNHIPLINMYKKCKGISLVNKYLPNLSPLNKMYVINSMEDWKQVENEFPEHMMTIRCDSPKGVNGMLPSGQTFDRNRVPGYINEVKTAVPDAVLILEDMKPGTNERIHTQGGINLDIQIGDYVLMEYVGPSFDCRELCTGKAAHESWNIPWEDVPFMDDNSIRKYKVGTIGQKEYIDTAKERLAFLIKAFPDKKDEILSTMPNTFHGMGINLFRDVRDNVIFPLWLQHAKLSRDGLRHFGVEVNVMGNGTLVPMEIDVPERFKSENKREESCQRGRRFLTTLREIRYVNFLRPH